MKDTRIPDLLIERVALGELSGDALEQARARIAADPDAVARLADIEPSNREILFSHPPARVAAQVHAQAGTRTRKRRVWMAAPAMAAAAAVMFMVMPGTPDVDPTGGPDVVRTKGLQPHLYVHRQLADGLEELSDQHVGHAGDPLQVSYIAAGQPHGVVLSVNDNGDVQLHHPATADDDTSLEPWAETFLPGVHTLANGAGQDRFILVLSDGPTDVHAVMRAAANAKDATLDLPDGYRQRELTIRRQ